MCFGKQHFKGPTTGTASCGLPLEEVLDSRYCLLGGQDLINLGNNNCSLLWNQAGIYFHTDLLATCRQCCRNL